MWARCRGGCSKPPGLPGPPRSHDSCVNPRSGSRAKAGLQLLRRDRNEEHRHTTVLHVSACLRDRGLLHPSLVEQCVQVGLIGTHPRVVLPVVRIVRGVAHLIVRPTPHDTQRAVLGHTRPPFSSAQSDVSRCGRPSRGRDPRCQPRVSSHAFQGLPVWHAVKMTGMNSASVALMRDQKKPFVDCTSMGHTRYAGTTNSLRKRRVLAVSSP